MQNQWQEDEARLYKLYKQEKDYQKRRRLQALWILRQGRLVKEVAQIVGVHFRTVQEWGKWYREGGVKAVLEHRHKGHGGRKSRLRLEQEAALQRTRRPRGVCNEEGSDALAGAEVSGVLQLWGMRRVFARLGMKKVPRPIAAQASAPVQEAWKKGAWRPR